MTKTLYIASDNAEEIIWVSKSEVKRDAEKLKGLGAQLVELGKKSLDKISLDDDLRTTIELTQKIKKKGRCRQLKFIGKMLRSRDTKPIYASLDKLKNRHSQQTDLFHKLEMICDRLVAQGDDVLYEILKMYPEADRQYLRTMIRNVRKEKTAGKSSAKASSRQIFYYLRELTTEV